MYKRVKHIKTGTAHMPMFRLCLGSVYVLSMLSLCSNYVLSIFHIIHSVYLPTMFRYLRSVWTSKETEVDQNIALACTGCYYSWNELCQPRQKCNLSRGSSDRVLAMLGWIFSSCDGALYHRMGYLDHLCLPSFLDLINILDLLNHIGSPAPVDLICAWILGNLWTCRPWHLFILYRLNWIELKFNSLYLS